MNASQLAAKRSRVTKPCLQCGEEFTGIKIASYCSERCRQKAKYNRKKIMSNREVPLSTLLRLDRPYDWSNKNIDKNVFALRVLNGGHLPDIARCTAFFGGQLMIKQLGNIEDSLTLGIARRKLNNAIVAIGEDYTQV